MPHCPIYVTRSYSIVLGGGWVRGDWWEILWGFWRQSSERFFLRWLLKILGESFFLFFHSLYHSDVFRSTATLWWKSWCSVDNLLKGARSNWIRHRRIAPGKTSIRTQLNAYSNIHVTIEETRIQRLKKHVFALTGMLLCSVVMAVYNMTLDNRNLLTYWRILLLGASIIWINVIYLTNLVNGFITNTSLRNQNSVKFWVIFLGSGKVLLAARL